jgi:hypothetical protein
MNGRPKRATRENRLKAVRLRPGFTHSEKSHDIPCRMLTDLP